MKHSFLLSASIGLVVSCHGSLLSAERDDQAKFKLLIRGMLDARQKVRSGEVRIEGTKLAFDDKGGLLNGELTGRYCFDATTGSYAWKWVYPLNLNIKPEGAHHLPASGPPRQFDVHYWACRNPNYFAEVDDIPRSSPHLVSGLNLRHPKDDFREKGGFCRLPPVDPLAAGIIGYFEYLRGKSAEDVYEGMLTKTVESYKSEGASVTVLLKDKVARHTLVIDSERMVPLKLTSRSLTDPSVFTSQAKWKTVDGVAVPVSITVQLDYPKIAEDIDEIELNWSRINEQFEAKKFEYTSFTGLPPNIIEVYDNRGKEPKHIGRWIADGKVEKRIDRP